jgi:hypothetical protein
MVLNNDGGDPAIVFMQNESERMRIDNYGNVGIGTGSPAYKLDVAGDINFSGTLRYQGVPALQVATSGGNTSAGYQALQTITSGTNDTAIGYKALALNTSGVQNTAGGGYSLFSNSSGSYNTAYGYGALQGNTTGGNSTAIGYNALTNNATSVGNNTAIGGSSLFKNASGADNTAAGYSALYSNTTGGQNTAVGEYSLFANQAGADNTAIGDYALYNAANGNNNIALGYQAGYLIGASGGTTSNNIMIGNEGTTTDNGAIRIGTTPTQTSFYAAGIRGTQTGKSDAVPVVIDSNGQLGTVNSSRRFKEDIHDMGAASRGLMRLRPVTFRYKQPFADGSKPFQYGLIAEEVAEVYPDLVVRSADGQIETVKYQMLDSMLLNEVQRQQAELEAQASRIRSLEQEAAEQRRQNQALADRLAKLEDALAAVSRR